MFSNPQLQSGIAGGSQRLYRFPARSRDNVFCPSRVANLQSRSVAPNRPTLVQSTVQISPRTSGAGLNASFFSIIVSCTFFDSSSKSGPNVTALLNILKCKSSSRYNLVRFLSTAFLDRGPPPAETQTLLLRPQGLPYL